MYSAAHSSVLVPSPWRVVPFFPPSPADMPSLTTVTLDRRSAFKHRKVVHTKSSSLSSSSCLDITPALQYYLSFPLSFTLHSSHPHVYLQLIQEDKDTWPYQKHIASNTLSTHQWNGLDSTSNYSQQTSKSLLCKEQAHKCIPFNPIALETINRTDCTWTTQLWSVERMGASHVFLFPHSV